MADRNELQRPVLNPAFVVVSPDPTTVEVRAGPWTGPVVTIQETEQDESIRTLFEELDGTNTTEEILSPYDQDDRETIRSLFDQLRNKNVIYDAADWNGTVGRPQIDVLPRFERTGSSRLEASSVLVVSIGELGDQVAVDLVRSGVGSVVYHRPLDDGPTPDKSGPVERVRNDESFSEPAEPMRTLVADADVAVFAADVTCPDIANAFNELADETGTPWMLAQVRGFDGLVGPVVYPGETACYRCLERRIEANIDDPGSYARYLDDRDDPESRHSTGLPSFARLVAGYAALDVLYLVSYGQAYTVGRTITVDFSTLSTEVNEVLKVPRCEVCGKPAGSDTKRFVTTSDLLESESWGRTERE